MAQAHLSSGMTLDGFRLEERLHAGGMAAIWRVTHPDVDTPIVLKAPFLDHKGNLSQLVGFEVEQMIMARLEGIHVPRFYANGAYTVQPYIIMEHIDGPTLLEVMDDKPMAPAEVFRRGLAMADALADLHGQQVFHLDLKPANVLFRRTGEAVLVDFGLSRHAHLPDLFHEQYLKPAGTTAYMAPEQLLRIRSDQRSDIFALGAMLYQMATGVRPFGTPGTVERVRRRVWLDPPPPRKLRPEIPPELQEIILKCIEPLPDRRYATAVELAFDLRHPELVEVTERALRSSRADPRDTVKRLMRSRTTMDDIAASATKPEQKVPIILVVVEARAESDGQREGILDNRDAMLVTRDAMLVTRDGVLKTRDAMLVTRDAMLEAAVSVLANMPGARLACISVRTVSLMPESNVDTAGRNIHVARIAKLRAWAAPLELPEGMLTCHLVEARSVAAGVLEFARTNAVAHIVVAGGSGTSGKLAAKLSANAPCPVTVVG